MWRIIITSKNFDKLYTSMINAYMYWPGNTSIIYTKEQKESYRTCICEETGIRLEQKWRVKSRKDYIWEEGRLEEAEEILL